MLSLRTADGLDLAGLRRQYGAAAVECLIPPIEIAVAGGRMQLLGCPEADSSSAAGRGAGALRAALDSGDPCGVRLTDPAGFLLSNDVISDLFAALSPAALEAA